MLAASNVPEIFTAAALLGSAMSAMLIGHSYLLAPAMSLTPLYTMLGALAASTVARICVAGLGLWLWTAGPTGSRYGHAAGDAYLVELAQRLRRQVRASDLVARLGGDEFFVMLEGVQDMVGVERVVVKIIDALRKPYPGIGDAQRRVSATLGVSIFPDDAPDATTLIEHADEAMYTAKQAGKNAYCLYSTGHKPPAGAPAAPNSAPQP